MSLPAPSAVAELPKPITGCPPLWAFACGVVASGISVQGRAGVIVGGVLLADPLDWGQTSHAMGIAGLLAVQLLMMRRFVADPHARAVWHSSLGVTLYVAGMLVAAFGLRGIAQQAGAA